MTPSLESRLQRALDARGYIVLGSDELVRPGYIFTEVRVAGPDESPTTIQAVVVSQTDLADALAQWRLMQGDTPIGSTSPHPNPQAWPYFYRCLAE